MHILKFTGDGFNSDEEFIFDRRPAARFHSRPQFTHLGNKFPMYNHLSGGPDEVTGEMELILNMAMPQDHFILTNILGCAERDLLPYMMRSRMSYGPRDRDYYYTHPQRVNLYNDSAIDDAYRRSEARARFSRVFDLFVELNVDKLDPEIPVSRAMSRVMGGYESESYYNCVCYAFEVHMIQNFVEDSSWGMFKLNIKFDYMSGKSF